MSILGLHKQDSDSGGKLLNSSDRGKWDLERTKRNLERPPTVDKWFENFTWKVLYLLPFTLSIEFASDQGDSLGYSKSRFQPIRGLLRCEIC